MTTKRLLSDYTNVLDKMILQGPSEELQFLRHCLDDSMQHYRLRHQYEQARIAYAVHREFSDSEAPLTARDIEFLDAAAAVNQEITILLRMRKGVRSKKVAS